MRLEEVAKIARAAVPDAEAIRSRISEIEAANAKARDNRRYAAAAKDVDALGLQIREQDELVVATEAERVRALAEAAYPVPGLGLDDAGVTLGGLPFSQAGSAEQIKVSVAIGAALNPGLKVLLVRNGNLLDSGSLKAVAAQAEELGMQIWMEYVSETGEGMSVMLVDGEVAS